MYKAVAESIREPLKYDTNNDAGLMDFCSLLNTFSIKTFIVSSSVTVYGELANSSGRLVDGPAVRNITNVTYLARGHVAALETVTRANILKSFQAFSLGTENGKTAQEVARAMQSVVERQIPTKRMGRRQKESDPKSKYIRFGLLFSSAHALCM